MDHSRRSFLKTSAGAVGLCLIGSSATIQALTSGAPEHPAGRIEPFPLASIRLASGILGARRNAQNQIRAAGAAHHSCAY